MTNIIDRSLADDDYALTREEYYRLQSIPPPPRVLPSPPALKQGTKRGVVCKRELHDDWERKGGHWRCVPCRRESNRLSRLRRAAW